MEKISQSFVSKLNRFQKRLEAILDNDFDKKVDETEIKLNFEPSQDPLLVDGLSIGLPDDHIDRAIVSFSRLALLFDSGVLLENQDGKWKSQAYFEYGLSHLIKNDMRPTITLPPLNMFDILRTSTTPLLKKLQIENIKKTEHVASFLIKVSPDYCFILNSALPEIWLKAHLENIRNALMNGMVD